VVHHATVAEATVDGNRTPSAAAWKTQTVFHSAHTDTSHAIAARISCVVVDSDRAGSQDVRKRFPSRPIGVARRGKRSTPLIESGMTDGEKRILRIVRAASDDKNSGGRYGECHFECHCGAKI
jgi:hypothetical protein